MIRWRVQRCRRLRSAVSLPNPGADRLLLGQPVPEGEGLPRPGRKKFVWIWGAKGSGTTMPRPPEESVAMLKRRAVLLAVWRLSPDPGIRGAIEAELYGGPDPDRATAEAERLCDLPQDVENP